MNEDITLDRPALLEVAGEDRVRVSLEARGRTVVGQADVEQSGSVAAAGAAATLDALDQLTPGAVTFALEWCEVLDPREDLPSVVTTLATVTVAGVPMRYAGAAVAEGDLRPAAARAILKSLNRRLQIMRP